MKRKQSWLVFLIVIVPLMFAACTMYTTDATGVAVFELSFLGYSEEGEKNVHFEVSHHTKNLQKNQEVPLLDDYSTSGYFGSLDPGKYDVTITLLNDDKKVIDHQCTVEVQPDETTRTRIEGSYENGEWSFEVFTIGSQTETSISIDKMKAILVEKRRYRDDTKNDPEQSGVLVGNGSFASVKGGEVTYPDMFRYQFTTGSRETSSGYRLWDEHFYFTRSDFFYPGTFQLHFFDANDLGDTSTYHMDLDTDGVSAAKVNNPSQGDSLFTTFTVTVEWSLPNDAKIEKLLIYVVDDDDDSILYDSARVDPSSGSIVMDCNDTVNPANNELMIFAVDKDVSLPDPGNYYVDNILDALIWDFDNDLNYIGVTRLWFSSSP